MKKGLSTILLPVYNGEKFVKEMLVSIKEQTYRPLQIIIGNDCATDCSGRICKSWIEENDNSSDLMITYIERKQNGGLAQNLSDMSEYIEGEYIFLSDQDDVWKKNKVEEQVKYFEENENCMVCLCDRTITDELLNVVVESEYQYRGYKICTMPFDEVIMHYATFAANTMAIRNNGKINEYLKIPGEVVAHDSFIAVMASHFGTVDYLYKPLLLYRIHGNNLSGNFSSQFSKGIVDAFLKNLKKSKRIQESYKKDGDIIIGELKRRFGIELDERRSPFVTSEKIRSRFIWAVKKTSEEYKHSKIGIWKQYK